MYVVKRKEYDKNVDLAEGDLVSLAYYEDELILGIVLQVALDMRNDDHLTLSEEILIAEVLMQGDVTYFDEDDLVIVEKCNS